MHNTVSLECVNQQKQVECLGLEAQMNEEKIRSCNDLLQMTSEKFHDTLQKVIEVEKEITVTKD